MAKDQIIHYLTPSEADSTWQLACNNIGHVHVKPGETYPPQPGKHPHEYVDLLSSGRRLHEYQILYINQGQGKLSCQGKDWVLEQGCSVLLFPGDPHSYAPDPETGWTEYWVGFHGKYIDNLVQSGVFSVHNPVYPHGLGSTASGEFRLLLDEIEAESPGFRLVASAHIIRMLAILYTSRLRSLQAEGMPEWFNLVRNQLASLVSQHTLDWKDIARQYGMTYTAFSAKFHEYSGLPPHQYWLGLKVNLAKTYLLAGKTVKETAWILGFESEYYFSRFFKKRTGISPSYWVS